MAHKLKVYYDARSDESVQDGDARAVEIAKVPAKDAKLNNMHVRELTFVFKDEKELNRAKFDLKEDGFRFFP